MITTYSGLSTYIIMKNRLTHTSRFQQFPAAPFSGYLLYLFLLYWYYFSDRNKAADFETAITATGFGKFNIILILIAIPTGWSSILETTSMSYVFPAAQCDLKLTLENKGFLNAITYIGQ